MASKRGRRRKAERKCAGKVRHADMGGALAAKRITGRRELLPYKCGICGGWHLGHMFGRVLRAQEA